MRPHEHALERLGGLPGGEQVRQGVRDRRGARVRERAECDLRRVPQQQRRDDRQDREQDPIRLAHVRATEPIGLLDLADVEGDADADGDHRREQVGQEREPRGMAEDRQRPVGVHDRQHGLDDRGEQHEEPPEDEGVHRARQRLLEELALPEHLRELASRADVESVGPGRGASGADHRPPHPGAPHEDDDGDREDRGERDGAQELARLRTSSVRAGTIWNRSPTMPRSAIRRIGASASLLIATMCFAPFMPTTCCSAPLMPAAM